ncbi:MAG: VCBS repeat-containing protein, partial [Deltaproteobacteria bacterium]|nr:VCBS repeat-containing protein [Deltaproteobacteria bacterium]
MKATDTEGATAAATRTVTIATPGVPAVAILAPVGGAVLSTAVPIAFLGEASDSADGPLTGSSLAWVSSKDGALGTGTSLTTTLSEASHTITLTAVNSLGAKQSATVTVNVQIGTPSLAIVEPEDGATGSDAQPMALKATATDGQDGDLTAKIEWYSDIAGWLGKGGAVAATLSPGAQTITAKVTDSNGLSASATRTVTITATPPAVTITAPANGTTADFQSSVTFTGSAADPTDGQLSAEKLAWSSNLNGFLGFGATLTTAALNPGIHVITLTGTDSDGAAASAAISLIVDNGQPIVTITTPAPNATFVAGQPVQLAGSATDTQDGALTEAALQWSSSLNGALGTGEAVTVQNLSPGAHTITLTATDTDGWETSAAVPITIILPKAPAVAIISPSPGKEFLHGDPITFQGSANDPEDGALGTGQVEWRSSLDGLLGDTLQFTAEFFSIGTHVVTFKAKDSQGMEGTATVTLVVMPKPPSVTILTPKPGQNIVSQAVCTPLNGEATDELDLILPDEAFEWRSNLVPEPLGLGKSICKDLSAGTHEITLTVTDSNGAQGLASAKLIVVAPDNKLLTTFADGKTSAIFSLEPQTPVIAYVTLPKEAQVTLAQVEIAGSISIQWQFMGEEAVGGDVIDVGYHSMPTFADIDGDGDQDLFIGFNAGGGGAGGIYFYRNDGTPAQHQWTFVTDNFGGFAKDNSMTNFAPDFMDVDKDGDPDVVIGWQDVISPETYAGHIDFYRNIGTAAESQWALENVFADGITGLMNYPRPALSDIDADGDVDLFSGAYNPEMSFYKNDGGVWTFITQYYPGVSCQYAGAFSPTFVDIDQDGDDDLFDGSDKLEENGFNQLIYYRNVGSPQQDVLTCIPFTLPGWNENVFLPAPTFTDIDADGDQDLFVGNYEGGVRFWQNPGPQYPFDPSFDVGGDNQYEWSHSGNYSGKETTADFSTVLNTYMASAPADPNGLVQVPFVVTSNSAGILELTNLNIQYQVTDTEPPTILGVGVNDPQCFVPPGGDCGVGHDKAGVVIAAKVSDNDDIAGVTATIGDGPPMTFTETGPDWYESPGFKAPGLPGPYLIAVTVTDTNGLSASGNLLLHVQTTGPELAIDQDLELSPAVPLDLQPAAITAMVHNYGGQKASFWIEFRLNGEFYDEKAMSLEEGETGKKVTFSGWVASVGVNTATIELDPEKLVPEQKVNNKATITFTVADGTPPVIGGVVFGPAWEGPIPITVAASDNDDIASVVASVAGKTVPCTYQPAQQNYQGVLEMNVGNYLVDVVATDSSGLSSHQQVPLVVKPQKADLAVGPADLTVTPANPQAGEAAIICMTLRNVGTQHVPFATGTLLIDSATVYSFTLSLDGGAALPPQCYSWKGSYEPHTLKFIADPNQEVEELDEGNNQTERSVSVVNQVPPQITALTIASPVTQGVPATVEAGVTSTVPLASVTATTPSGTVPLICVDGLCKGQVVYPQPGASFVTVTATDESGLKQSKEQPVTVLANLPDLSVQQVKVMEVQVIDGSPAAIVTTVRNLGTASAEPINVTFRVDGKTKGETTLPGLNGEAVVQFQWSAQYGPHTAEIAVDPANALIEADEGNNSYQWSIHVIDQTPPVIEIVEAPKSIPVGTPLPVSVAAWDNVALASVTAQLGEASGQLGYNASSKRYEGSVPTPVTGLLPLTISAKDTSGLAATYSVGVTVAEDTPDVAVAAMAVIPAVVPEDAPLPIAFSVQNFGGIAVTTKIHLVVDGAVAQAQPVSLGANAAVPQEMTITPAYGEHVAKIIADPDGTLAEPNEANNQLMFTFFAADLTPPTPPALAVAPVGWSEVTTFTVTWGAATDKHGIAEYQYRLDQNPWQSVGNTTTWTAGPVSEGEHTIAVRAIDSHGNVSEPGYAAIKSDVSPPPAPLLEETHCGTIWTTHDSPQLTWATPPDPGSGVARYRLAIDGVETILGNVNMYHPTLESGIHTFRLRAVDLLEHAGPWSNTITVRIDTAPPRAPAILSPTHPDAEPSPNNRPLCLLTAHPDTSGVVGYSYLFDQLPTTTPGPYDLWRSADVSGTTEIAITAMPTMTGEMLPVADGAWYLHAVAKDAVGLVSPMAAHYEIQIDTVPALTRFDIDGDGQGDAVIHQDGKGLYRQRLADPADPAPLLLKGLVPAFVNGDVIDMARRVTGWPATLWLWDNAIQTLTSYQPTLNTVGAGKLLA